MWLYSLFGPKSSLPRDQRPVENLKTFSATDRGPFATLTERWNGKAMVFSIGFNLVWNKFHHMFRFSSGTAALVQIPSTLLTCCVLRYDLSVKQVAPMKIGRSL